MSNTNTTSRRAFLETVGAGVVGAAVAASAAPADDKALLSAVNDEADLELIKRMVQIASFSRQETPLARFLVDYMKGLGLETELQEVQAGRYQAISILRGTGGGK